MYFLLLSIFLFSFACSHSRSSSRLHLVLTLWDFTSFFPYPNGRMASPFISSSFPSFIPFTLFTSSHNKCKPTYLDFASTNFFSSALPYPNHPCLLLLSFLSSFSTVSPKPTNPNNWCWLMLAFVQKWACLSRGLDSWCSAHPTEWKRHMSIS